MKYGSIQKTLFVALAFILLSLSSFVVSVWAEDYTSDNFILRDPVITIEGGRSTSSSFEYFSTTGPRAKIENTSSSFIQRVGFLYFPIATSPVLLATSGDGEVSLTWTASVPTLANITDYQVGTATTSGGSYTFESVGNALSFTKTGLTNDTAYYFKLKALAGTLVLAQSSEASATPTAAGEQEEEEEPPPGGGGGGSYTPPSLETKVILQGKAYPDSLVTVLKDGKTATVRRVDYKANFEAEITDLTAGIYTFGVWAKDKNGIKSITYTLTFRVLANTTTTISGIFLPPTIDLDRTSLLKGEVLNIFGQTVPEVEVDVHIYSSEIIEQVQTDEIGSWLLAFDTQPLEEGIHITKARFNLNEEERSGFSGLLTFYVGEEGMPEEFRPRADLDKDGKTNLVDFSILLYWWGRSNVSVDQNRNGVVDLPDFSIMMYYWTG